MKSPGYFTRSSSLYARMFYNPDLEGLLATPRVLEWRCKGSNCYQRLKIARVANSSTISVIVTRVINDTGKHPKVSDEILEPYQFKIYLCSRLNL